MFHDTFGSTLIDMFHNMFVLCVSRYVRYVTICLFKVRSRTCSLVAARENVFISEESKNGRRTKKVAKNRPFQTPSLSGKSKWKSCFLSQCTRRGRFIVTHGSLQKSMARMHPPEGRRPLAVLGRECDCNPAPQDESTP
jgi:hypothetical protein